MTHSAEFCIPPLRLARLTAKVFLAFRGIDILRSPVNIFGASFTFKPFPITHALKAAFS